MNILFVCTMNVARSVTAERLYRNTAGMRVRSAGVSPRARRLVSAADVEWAEKIVTFEPGHLVELKRRFGEEIAARVLDVDIDDAFAAGSPDLEAAVRDSLVDVLGPPGRAPR